MARLIVSAAVGIAVGYFAGPVAGFQAFGLAYGVTGFLDPNKHILGPKLNDLKAPTASYGTAIPYVQGSPRLAGCYVWSSDKREIATTTEQGGKGGPGVDSTTYTYELDCLVMLASNQCAAITRVWSNGRLVWDKRTGADAETIDASTTANSWRDIRFYGGADDQLPDPTYEAAVGVGNAPAYRGRATVLIEGLNLGGSGQLPILTFEVVSDGETSTIPAKTLVRADFDALDGTDSSAYHKTPALVGAPTFGTVMFSAQDGAWKSNGNHAANYVSWAPTFSGAAQAFTMECFAGYSSLNFLSSDFLMFSNTSQTFRVSWFGDTGQIAFTHLGTSGELLGPVLPANGLVHVAIVVPASNPAAVRLYVAGLLAGTMSASNGDMAGSTFVVGSVTPPALVSSFYVTGAKLTKGEVYTGTNFVPPETLPPADDPTDTATPTDLTLATVVKRLCLRTRQLVEGDIDVTDLEADVVHAMAVSQVSTTRATLEMLMGAYPFECVEGDTVRFVKRGGGSAVTIPYEDLGASKDGTAEPLPIRRINDMEVAARVSVKFGNILNDFQDGVEAADRLTTDSTAETVMEIPLGLTPTEAKKLADRYTMDLATSLLQIGPVSLMRTYAALQPTDVITLVDAGGSSFRARIAKATAASGGLYTFDLLLDEATIVASEAATDADYSTTLTLSTAGDTEVQLLDIPILRDEDNSAGFYAAFNAEGTWPGAELDRSTDNVTYVKKTMATGRAVMGVTA